MKSKNDLQKEGEVDLPDDIYEKITSLSDAGNDYLDNEKYKEAIVSFNKAMALLPEPQNEWEAYTWLNGSLADAYFHLNDFPNCAACAYDALNGPDGMENPFVHLRLGQALFEQGQMERAESELLQAHMLAGIEIFSEDHPKYLRHMQEKYHL